jgi:deazaflavin-dependent oxidoreductase (nitroreductase family)
VQSTLGHLIAADSHRRGAGRILGWLVELPVLGRLIARAGRAPLRLPLAHRITRAHARLLRRSGGRLKRSWLFAAGQPVLALTTTGRRSGLPRTTAVACFRDGDDLAIAGMNLGMQRDPDWARNLDAHPEASIELNGRTIDVTARRATGTDAERLWRRWAQLQPSALAFRQLAGRPIPLFVLRRR